MHKIYIETTPPENDKKTNEFSFFEYLLLKLKLEAEIIGTGGKTNLHLFGVENGNYFVLGTDKLGRCLFSRMLVGSQVSLTVGIIGILISFSIGIFMGGISGYYGG